MNLKDKIFAKLSTTLGQFFENFNEQKFEAHFIKGKIKLEDLVFKPEAVNAIFKKRELPIMFKAGRISTIEINVRKQPSYATRYRPGTCFRTHS
jgi:hypothetical protein